MGNDRLATGDTAENAARMVGQESLGSQLIAVLRAALGYAREACTDLDTLDGVDAHQRMGQLGIQPIEDGLAEARHHAVGDHGDLRAHRILVTAQLVHVSLKLRHLVRIGAEKGVLLDAVPGLEGDLDRAELAHVATHLNAEARQVLLGNRSSRHAHGGFTRRAAATTTVIADTIFVMVGVVGMRRAEQVLDRRVVLGLLVGVADQQANRAASRPAFENAREDLDLVGFLALGGVAAGAGLAPV